MEILALKGKRKMQIITDTVWNLTRGELWMDGFIVYVKDHFGEDYNGVEIKPFTRTIVTSTGATWVANKTTQIITQTEEAIIS